MSCYPDCEYFSLEGPEGPYPAIRIPVKNSDRPCVLYQVYAEPLLEAAERANLAWVLNKGSVCLVERLGREDMRGNLRFRADVHRIIALPVPDQHRHVLFKDGDKLNLLRDNLLTKVKENGGIRNRVRFILEVTIRIAVLENNDAAAVQFGEELFRRLWGADGLTPPP